MAGFLRRSVTRGAASGRPARFGRLRAPLANGHFRRLVAGKGISFLGDWLLIAGLVGWIYGRTGSTGYVAALMLVRLVPPVFGGLVGGSLVDRFPRRRLLVGAELACGVAVAGVLVGVLRGSEILVFACFALCTFIGPTGAIAMNAIVPDLVDDACRPAANAVLAVAMEIAMAAGGVAAGVSLSGGTASIGLILDILSFAAAALLFAGIPAGTRVAPAVLRGSRRVGGAVRQLLSGRTLLVLACAFALVTLATGLTNATLPRFLSGFGLGAGGYGFGLGALATGSAIGEAVYGAVASRPGLRTFAAATAVSCLPFAALAFASSGAAALTALAFLGLVSGAGEVVLVTLVQQEAAPELRGRAFGLVTTMNRVTMLSAVAAAPLVNRIAAPRIAVLVSVAVTAGAAALAYAGSPHGRHVLRRQLDWQT